MEINITPPLTELPKLSNDDETELVAYVKQAWEDGINARREYDKAMEKARKSYKCQLEDEKWRRDNNLSTVCLPWAFNAHETYAAYMSSALWPNDLDPFVLKGRTRDDVDGCQIMTQYENFKLEEAGFYDKLHQALKELSFGYVAMKMSITNKGDKPGLHLEVLNIKDFANYPLEGEFHKTTRIHRTWKYLEDLKATADALEQTSQGNPYINLDKLKPEDEEPPCDYRSTDKSKRNIEGIELKEAWIHHKRLKSGILLRDVIVTIAKDDVLIRYSQNPYPEGEAPIIALPLIPDEDKSAGWGISTMAQKVLDWANEIENMALDVTKVHAYPQLKFLDDGVFDPASYVARPGGMIEVGDINNLQPIATQLENMQWLDAKREALKIEYEETTIPRMLKGQLDTATETATQATYMQKNASTVISQQAKRINEKLLKPIVKWGYTLLYRLNEEEGRKGSIALEMARLTQESTRPALDLNGQPVMKQDGEPERVDKTPEELIAELPRLLPDNEIDIRVIGFQNIQERDKQAFAFQTGVPLLAQSPAAMYIKWGEAGESGLQAMGIDPHDIFMNADERKKADAMAEEQRKAEQDALATQAQQAQELQLKALELDYQKTERKAVVDEAHNQQQFALGLAKLEQDAETDADKAIIERLKLQMQSKQAEMKKDEKPAKKAD